jgi:competence protein ComEC
MNQPNLLVLIGLALGIVTAAVAEPGIWWIGTGLVLGALVLGKKWLQVFLIIAGLGFGFLYWGIRVPEPPAVVYEPTSIELVGVVQGYPRITAERTSFDLQCEQVGEGLSRVRVTGYFSSEVRRGDVVRIKGRLQKVRSPGNPGEFDYQQYLERRNIYYTLTVKKPAHIQVVGEQRSRAETLLIGSRERGIQAINETLPPRQAALLKGMVLGERDEIDPEDYRDFQKTGIVHVLAVSGLHVGFVVLLVYGVGLLLGLSERKKMLGAAVAVFVYGCLVGWPLSLLRASLMVWLGMLAYYVGREKNPVNALAVAGLVLLLAHPTWLFEIAFQLSFMATWGLVYIFPILREKLPGKGWLKDAVLVPAAAQLGILPVVIYHFSLLSVSSLVVNIVGIYLAGAAVILGLCGLLAALVWVPLASVFLLPAGLAVDLITLLVGGAAVLPGSYLWVARPPGWGIAAYYGGILLLIRGLAVSSRRQLLVGTLIIGVFITWLVVPPGWKHRGELQVTFLDVGQGDSILIKTPQGRFVLVDAGGSQFWDVGHQVVVSALARQGIRNLDAIIISHPDLDHIGGVEPVMEEMQVKWLGVSQPTYPAEEYRELERIRTSQGIPVVKLAQGQRLNLEPELDVTVIYPERSETIGQISGNSYNDSSLVVRVQYGRISFLLTGDVEKKGMEKLVETGTLKQATVVKVPHHGSRGSLHEPFYDAARPRTAVISVGANNTFGHPAPEVVEFLRGQGIQVYRTDQHGAIIFGSDGQRLWVETVRPTAIPAGNVSVLPSLHG